MCCNLQTVEGNTPFGRTELLSLFWLFLVDIYDLLGTDKGVRSGRTNLDEI